MSIQTTQGELETRGHADVKAATAALHAALSKSKLKEGQATVFVAGSTAGVTTVEFEPGLVKDLAEFFQKIIPEGPAYHHHDTWGDDNGSSPHRTALLKPRSRCASQAIADDSFRRQPAPSRNVAAGGHHRFRHAGTQAHCGFSDR